MNCCVVQDEVLRYHEPKHKHLGKNRKKNQTGKLVSGPMDSTQSNSFTTASGGGPCEVYQPVKCVECSTEVAVYDKEEVYHFFNVLTSHAWKQGNVQSCTIDLHIPVMFWDQNNVPISVYHEACKCKNAVPKYSNIMYLLKTNVDDRLETAWCSIFHNSPTTPPRQKPRHDMCAQYWFVDPMAWEKIKAQDRREGDKCNNMNLAIRSLPWSQRFSFAAKRISSDRQRSGKRKPLVTRDANLTIILR